MPGDLCDVCDRPTLGHEVRWSAHCQAQSRAGEYHAMKRAANLLAFSFVACVVPKSAHLCQQNPQKKHAAKSNTGKAQTGRQRHDKEY